MDRPAVSVIIPAYNAGRFVAHAIESVLEQSFNDVEILVVDDGSTDGTACRVATYGDRVVYVDRPHGGAGSARNHGARLANGEWLAFLDADDFWYPHKLSDQIRLTRDAEQVDLVLGNYHTIEESGRIEGEGFANHPMVGGRAETDRQDGILFGPQDAGRYARNRFGITSTLLVRADLFHRVGGFDERFEVAEDIHLLYRLVARARSFGAIRRPGAAYRRRNGSASRQDAERRHRVTIRALTDLLRHHDLPVDMRDALRQEIARTRLDLAYLLARQRRRMAATLAAGRAMFDRPSWEVLRTVGAVNRPIRPEPSCSPADPVEAFLFGMIV